MKKICLPVMLLFLSGCLSSTPFQSARVVEPGQQSASVSLQKSVDANDPTDFAWYMMEFAGRMPVADGRMDFSLGGAIMVLEDDDGLSGVGGMFGLGTKVELWQDILAVELPARVVFAGESTLHTTHLYPRAILSVPVAELVEINLSHTRYLFMDNEGWTPYAFSLGLAFGRQGGAIFRPEIGILVFPEDNDILQFGIGYTPEAKAPPPTQGFERNTPY
ncbi:MAG: hypothetical protein ABFS42_03800 [Candidatus Krumholzibacteriota bacterium]